jgi:two-component system, OmpR family, flagellar system response regulator FtcR
MSDYSGLISRLESLRHPAAIEAAKIIRELSGPKERHATFGLLTVYFNGRETEIDGAPVGLTPRESSVLKSLAWRRGYRLTRSNIFEAVWGYNSDCQERIVDIYILRLRRKLKAGLGYNCIHSRHSAGYKLVDGPVECAAAA